MAGNGVTSAQIGRVDKLLGSTIGEGRCTAGMRGDIVGYREVIVMADVLIRDVPEAVLAAVDAHASRLGLSRVEYIRRRLAADAATSGASVTKDDLRSFADKVSDLADPEVMGAAWQ